ncbi:hypothetical protein L7F22_064786 [Adiantum nelumboides]|nr:hypothetical protein [Adiantum nelumboides]
MAERIMVWLQSFDSALKSRDIPSAVDLFCAEECYWRDLVAFTWNLYTAESREEIHAMLGATLHHTSPSAWTIDGPAEEAKDGAVLQAFITFETQKARGRGYVKLKGDKCWCLLTSMLELKGFEEKAGLRRELGVLHGAVKSRKTWLDGRAEELQALGGSKQPHCLIVGGGQAGIALGARLRRLCVPTIIIEKNKRPGDSWRNRYKSLASMIQFGMSGFPNMPKLFGSEMFQGLQCHSSAYKGGEGCKGKHCVVIGSNNSAHDICAEMWENEAAEVTMVQRSSTSVMRSETMLKLGIGEYREHPRHSVDDADLLFASVPFKIFHRTAVLACKRLQEIDAEFYRRLKDCGFMLDFGDDESGLILKYLRRGSGYYIDVGASDLVINGDIKLKSGVEVKEVKEKSVVFSDGTEAKADVIVYATGYGSMNEWAARLISQEVADKVGKCWGLGSGTTKDPGPWERELRNMWKPTQQESLWFHGGNLHQSRHYSLLLALQLKARMEGIAAPVYGLAKVHHIK